MARANDSDAIGLVAMLIGAMLMLGGVMFLSVTPLMNELPRLMLAPPIVQIGLGAVGCGAGFLLRRGYAVAKVVLFLVAVCVVVNVAVLVSMMIASAH